MVIVCAILCNTGAFVFKIKNYSWVVRDDYRQVSMAGHPNKRYLHLPFVKYSYFEVDCRAVYVVTRGRRSTARVVWRSVMIG